MRRQRGGCWRFAEMPLPQSAAAKQNIPARKAFIVCLWLGVQSKTMVAGVARGKPLEIWFQDEARIGQQGTLTRFRAAGPCL